MNIEDIRKIAVIGAGNMGHQIALQAALSGYQVACSDINEKTLEAADSFVDEYLPGRVKKGRLTAEQAQQARGRVRFTDSMKDAVHDADYVIEAATEVLELKRRIFSELDTLAPSHAILATNSSAIVSSKIADATQRPDKVVNMHFFNPALVMK